MNVFNLFNLNKEIIEEIQQKENFIISINNNKVKIIPINKYFIEQKISKDKAEIIITENYEEKIVSSEKLFFTLLQFNTVDFSEIPEKEEIELPTEERKEIDIKEKRIEIIREGQKIITAKIKVPSYIIVKYAKILEEKSISPKEEKNIYYEIIVINKPVRLIEKKIIKIIEVKDELEKILQGKVEKQVINEVIKKISEDMRYQFLVFEIEEPITLSTGHTITSMAEAKSDYTVLYGKIEEIVESEDHQEQPYSDSWKTVKIYTKTPVSIIVYTIDSDYPSDHRKIIYILKKKSEKTEEEEEIEQLIQKYNLPSELKDKLYKLVKEGAKIKEIEGELTLTTGYSDTTKADASASYSVIYGEIEIVNKELTDYQTFPGSRGWQWYSETIKPTTPVAIIYYEYYDWNSGTDKTIYILKKK